MRRPRRGGIKRSIFNTGFSSRDAIEEMDRNVQSNDTRTDVEAEMNGLRSQLESARETIARSENEREALRRDVVRERENLRQLGETLVTTTRNAEKIAQELNEARDEVKSTLELVANLHERNAQLKTTVENNERELSELREQTRESERKAREANEAIELMCDLYVNKHSRSFENEPCFFAMALGDGMVNGRCVRLFEIERGTRGELARMVRDMFRESCDAERRYWFDSAYGTANVLTNWCSPKVLLADRFHLPVGYAPKDFVDPNKDHVLNAADAARFLLLKASSASELVSMLLTRGTRSVGGERATNEDAMEIDLKGVHDGVTGSEDEPAVRRNDSGMDEDSDDDHDDANSSDDFDATTFTRNHVRRILRKKPRLCLALTLRPLTYKSPASVRVSPSGGLRRRAPLVRTATSVYYSTNTDVTAGQVLRAIKELFESVAKTMQQRERNRTRYELLRLLTSAKTNPRTIAEIRRDD